MKIVILLVSVLCLSTLSFASHHEGGHGKGKGKMSMEDKKAKMTANLDTRIASLTEFKACVAKATEKGSLKACRAAHKDRVKSLKGDK